MPTADVRGGTVAYEILGDTGPLVALSPGGRSPMEKIRPIAERIAQSGRRVMIHDRRNCGRSDVAFDGSPSENEMWVDDLHALLTQLNEGPVVIGGPSSGCRLALGFARRHPQSTRALLLWRLSGGPFAAAKLAEEYYGPYVAAARSGGMAAVCDTDFFKERIAENAGNQARLMAMPVTQFVEVMTRWRKVFDDSAAQPVLGASDADLKSISSPTCIIPGNDRIHSRAVGEAVHRLVPNSELHVLAKKDDNREIVPPQEWVDEAKLAATLLDFMERACTAGPSVARRA